MITPEKLAVFRKFGGDVDAWHLAGSPGEHTVITADDWSALVEILQELTLLKKNLASEDYAVRIRAKLTAMTSDAATANELLEIP